MDKYKKYFDNEDELLPEKIKIEPSKLYMKNYIPDIKVHKSPLEEVSKNLLKPKIDTKSLNSIHNISQSYVKTLTPVTDYYKSAINFSSIKPDIGKAIKVTTIPNKIDLSQFSKEISKPITMSESYSNTIESIKNATSTSLISTKLVERTNFKIPNIGMESSVKISNSLKDLLKTYPVKVDTSEFSNEISKPILSSESYSNMIESIENRTSTSLISTKLIERTNFKIPNIRMESSVRISNSIKDLLKTNRVKVNVDIQSLEKSLDKRDIFFSKPSEMTSFILDNTENARSLTIEEAKTIDSIEEAKDDNELIEAYDKSVKIFEGNVELLISYILLVVTIFASFSNNFYAGTLFGKTIDEFLDPAFKDIHKKAKKILDPKDNETSKKW